MYDFNIREVLAESNEEMLFADGFDYALVGVVERCGQPTVALYDSDLCVEVLMKEHGMTEDEAWEYFEFNVKGSYVGENTPAFMTRTTYLL